MPRKEAIARSAAMLEQLGIGPLAQEAPFRLSHGQRLRVALAGVLVASPPLLLLDEPSTSLDPPGREQLIALLKPYPAAMLVATHDRDFAGQTCSRSIVLENGRLT
jgi:energy-coupling factor transporter ATP-binding protein EcfA2